MSRRKRNGLLTAALAVLAIVVFLLLHRERSWSVALSSDRDEAPPWISFQLQAALPGAPDDVTGWSFQWSANDGMLQSSGRKAVLRAATLGAHQVTLKVTSPRGTEHDATLDLMVKVGEVMQSPASAAASPTEATERPESPIVLDDVTVEKSKVCAGEPSTISVRASYQGTDSNIRTLIDGHPGNQVAFARYFEPPGLYRVRVVVSDRRRLVPDRTSYTYIQVMDCKQDQAMMLTAEPTAPTRDEYALRATYANLNKPGQPLESKATEYHWDFGDGKRAVTTGMTIHHVFPHEAERADKLMQSYLVTLEGVDATGAVLSRANVTIGMDNMLNEFKEKYAKLVLIADYVGIPVHDERLRTYTEDVTLMNPDSKETATLGGVSLEFRDCQGETQEVRPVVVTTVFPETSIPPRGQVAGHMVLSDDDVKDRCFVHASVSGVSSPSGLQVDGRYVAALGRPPNGKTISDPVQLAALAQARQILKKQFITPGDLQTLEDEGRIQPGLFSTPVASVGSSRNDARAQADRGVAARARRPGVE